MRDPALPCPRDLVNRRFQPARPNALWVADFTYVPTAQGFVYTAFVTDALARVVVGWRVARAATAGFALDALEQALASRKLAGPSLIHHRDRGSQYVTIKYAQRLAQAAVEPSVGSKGDSYDNALSETMFGLHNAELMHRRANWPDLRAVERATMEWVSWFNTKRLLGSIGNIQPAEAEKRCYENLKQRSMIPAKAA